MLLDSLHEELGLSHMARAGFEHTPDTALRTLGTSPIKWGQSPDMTIAVDYNVLSINIQTNCIANERLWYSCGDTHARTHTSNKILTEI